MRRVLTGLILVVLAGCSSNNSSGGSGGAAGASSGGSSSGGAAGSGGSNTGGSNTGGSNTGGSNTGGSGGTVGGSCSTLCSHTNTASPSEADCVSSEALAKGYDWPSDPVCSTFSTEGECNICTSNLAMPDADCAAVENTCFGAGSGGSGGGVGGVGGIGGIGGVGGGNTGGTGGGSGAGCAAFCQNAPSATSAQEQCVEVQAYLMGYDWSAHPVCGTADTVPGCNACIAALAMPDSACSQLENMCF